MWKIIIVIKAFKCPSLYRSDNSSRCSYLSFQMIESESKHPSQNRVVSKDSIQNQLPMSSAMLQCIDKAQFQEFKF